MFLLSFNLVLFVAWFGMYQFSTRLSTFILISFAVGFLHLIWILYYSMQPRGSGMEAVLSDHNCHSQYYHRTKPTLKSFFCTEFWRDMKGRRGEL